MPAAPTHHNHRSRHGPSSSSSFLTEDRSLIATVAMVVLTGAILAVRDSPLLTNSKAGSSFPSSSTAGGGAYHRGSSSIGFEQLCYKELPTRSTLPHDIHSSSPLSPSESHADEITDKRKKRKLALRLMIEWSKALAANNVEASKLWESFSETVIDEWKNQQNEFPTTETAPLLGSSSASSTPPSIDDVLSLTITSERKNGEGAAESNPRVLLAVFLAFVSDMQKRLPSSSSSTFAKDEYDINSARLSVSSKSFAIFMHLMSALEESDVQTFREELLSIFSNIAINGPAAPSTMYADDQAASSLTAKPFANSQGVLTFLRYRVNADARPTLSICSLPPAPTENSVYSSPGTAAPRREPTCSQVDTVVIESTSSASNPIESHPQRPQMDGPPPLTHCETVSHPFVTASALHPAVSSAFTRNIVPIGTRLPSTCVRLFMGQLRKDNTEEAVMFLLEHTTPHITLLRVQPHTNPHTGRGKGCAWVYVATEADAQEVLKLHKRAFFDCAAQSEENRAHDAQTLAAAKNVLFSTHTQKAPRNASEGIWLANTIFNGDALTTDEERFFGEMADCRAFVARRPAALPRRAVVVEVPQSAEKSLTGVVTRESHHQHTKRPYIPRANQASHTTPQRRVTPVNFLEIVQPQLSFANYVSDPVELEATKIFTRDGSRFSYNPYGPIVAAAKHTVAVSASASSSPAFGASEENTEAGSTVHTDVDEDGEFDRTSMCAEAATSRQISMSLDWIFHEGNTIVSE